MSRHASPSDTHPEARRVHIELMRQAPAWRKLQAVDQMREAVRAYAASGLRSRHRNASEAEIQRRLADLLLGSDLAARAYGAPPTPKSHDS